jgi:hypothetical protein
MSLIALPGLSYAELIVLDGKRPGNIEKLGPFAEWADIVQAVGRQGSPFYFGTNEGTPAF